MKITITTPTNAPYGIHANTIADLLKRALATFALQREEDQVLVEHEGVAVVVEESEVSDGKISDG